MNSGHFEKIYGIYSKYLHYLEKKRVINVYKHKTKSLQTYQQFLAVHSKPFFVSESISEYANHIPGKAGHYQVILKRVEMPVVRHDFCQTSLRQTRLGPHFNLDSTFICAGGEAGKDTCQVYLSKFCAKSIQISSKLTIFFQGDGGSPLVCPIRNKPGRYAQAGIVAWGIGCGGSTPGVYANVASARHWIDDHMNRRNYGTRYYSYFVDS